MNLARVAAGLPAENAHRLAGTAPHWSRIAFSVAADDMSVPSRSAMGRPPDDSAHAAGS